MRAHPALLTTVVWLLAGGAASAGDEPPEFAAACFGDFDDAQPYPTVEELRRLLVPAEKHYTALQPTTKRLGGENREIVRATGVFRLTQPWRRDTTLRLSLLDAQLLQLNFWIGQQGVTFRYCAPALNTWAAYGATREGASPRPATYAVWSLDAGRYRRSGLGTVEVRHHDGQLLLTRGDLLLLAAPLAAPPQEVYLEGSSLVRGLTVYASRGGPSLPAADPAVLRLARASEGEWTCNVKEAVIKNRDDGAVELSAPAAISTAIATVKTPGPGLHQYVFQVERPQPGTGLVLADEKGHVRVRLGFFRDRSSGRTAMAWLPSHLSDTEMTFAFDETAAPFVGARHWLRLTVGSGVAKCWTSGDGRLWSQAIYAPSPVLGGIHRAGLYVLPGAADRAVGLRTFEVRRFERLMALAPEALLQHPSAALDATAGLDELRRRAVKSRPADADPAVWQRACLLRTLAENPSPSLAAPLLHQLVEEAIAAEGDPAAQFQLLDEAAAVANNNDLATVRAFTAYYERVGRAMRRGGQAGTLDAVGASLLRSPLWGYERQACWPAELLRYEMLDLAMRDGWQPAAAALERLDFWTRPDRLETRKPPWDPATEHLVEWARFETARRRAAPTEPPPVPLVFRPRWIERIDRESFNVASEIRSALQARAFPEAAQTIAASARPDLPGLLPDADDPRLWLSLPTALSRAMQQSPELLEAMRTELGARGKLRLTRAVAVGDTAAAESIALQFLGAEAAGEALAWLGDRALSAGRPGPAARYYRRGLAWLPEAARADAAARLRLAAAMLGEQAGQPVQAAVHVGDLQLTAAEFEKLVREVRHAAGGDNGGPDDARLPFDPAAAPPALEAKKWARLDGGDLPRPAGVSDNSFDWAALQVALASAGDKLLVATPTTLAAYQTSDGKKAWSAQAKGGETQTATGPMQPLVRGGRIYVRWPAEGGAALRCLDADNGREVWTVRPAGHVISDPLWAEDALFALALGRELTQPAQVWLCKCDPASGQVLRETPAAEFRHDGGSRVSCRATAAGERLIASLWGCVLCCDLEGRAVWARQQVYVPPPASPPAVTNFWARQRHGPPCVQGQRIFVAQPGVWSVECLDVETGTLVWRQPLPELIGVTGVAGGRVIVETADGPAALDAESGRLLWRSGWPDPLDGRWLCGAGGVLLAASREPADGQLKRRLRVHGMDLASGKLLGGADLAGVRGEAALLGPIASFGGRLWACKAAADDPAQRDLVELRPATP